ncbi:MAG: SDR family oxidoreductase [Aeriscardovia sp.]|nr:SDR family oxidoreductase [Aeriscardovia sp.]
MKTDFEGAGAVVTGAGSGIGKLIAKKLASQGAKVAAWDIDGPAVKETVKEIADVGGESAAFEVDCGDFDAVMRASKVSMRFLGRLNILVNDAGVVVGKRFEDLSEKEVERVFKVNALSLFWTNKAFLKDLKKSRRSISVTVASAAGLIGSARLTAYSASKFAAVGFDSSLRNELKKEKCQVKTLLVCPFYISTGMFEGVKTKVPALLPILKPETVADKIVEAIKKGKERLILPPFAGLAGFIANSPVFFADRIENIFGINSCMDEFVGRKKND